LPLKNRGSGGIQIHGRKRRKLEKKREEIIASISGKRRIPASSKTRIDEALSPLISIGPEEGGKRGKWPGFSRKKKKDSARPRAQMNKRK